LNKKKIPCFKITQQMTILVITLVMVFFWVCKREKTEQERIKEIIESVEKYVEKKYVASILDLLSHDFVDMEDRTKTELEELLIKYYERHSGIVIHILGTRFLNIGNTRAEVETEVSLSSGAARFFRKIVKYYGETYRFNLTLVRINRQWKIHYAEWRYINLEELFPESFKILKKIFPKL